ncbi:MAG: hypothetical protein J2P22_08815 [Nocardioides sp.]|nr:hypothetical protein [Nocardioides sp.]
MRIAVDTGVYVSAMDLMYDANRGVTDVTSTLAGALAGCGGMSGTDSGGREWAQSYDSISSDLVKASADLGGALGSMANLLNASLVNHEGADHGARIYGYAGDDGDKNPMHCSEHLYPATIPSAFGGVGGEPDGWGWLAVHLEGLLWPDADTRRMRSAGSAWLAAGQVLDSWSSCATSASYDLESQQSPEAPIAAGAARQLASHCTDLGAACHDVGTACQDYATQVEQHHDEIISCCQELLAWTVVDEVSGAVLSLVTGGGAEVAAQLVEAGIMARYAERVMSILRRLIVLARAAAGLISSGLAKVTEILATLRKFLSVKAIRAVERVGAEQVENEAAATRQLLTDSEKRSGHTLERHVGLSDPELASRRVKIASTYTDNAVAELGISRVLESERATVEGWLRSGSRDDLVLNGDAGQTVGRTLAKDELASIPTSHLRIVIRRDTSMSEGYYIHTSYPIP